MGSANNVEIPETQAGCVTATCTLVVHPYNRYSIGSPDSSLRVHWLSYGRPSSMRAMSPMSQRAPFAFVFLALASKTHFVPGK